MNGALHAVQTMTTHAAITAAYSNESGKVTSSASTGGVADPFTAMIFIFLMIVCAGSFIIYLQWSHTKAMEKMNEKLVEKNKQRYKGI